MSHVLRTGPGVHAARALVAGEALTGTWFDRTQEYAAHRGAVPRLAFPRAAGESGRSLAGEEGTGMSIAPEPFMDKGGFP